MDCPAATAAARRQVLRAATLGWAPLGRAPGCPPLVMNFLLSTLRDWKVTLLPMAARSGSSEEEQGGVGLGRSETQRDMPAICPAASACCLCKPA